MKTPMTLGQKKTKAIDQLLEELGVGRSGAHEGHCDPLVNRLHCCFWTGLKPMPTEQICVQFNELRYCIYEITTAVGTGVVFFQE